MKPITEVYPDSVREWGFIAPCEYQPMLESFGWEIAAQVSDDDYQGDSRLLYRDGERVGFFTFGWGSCSGCDALQACNSLEELEALRQELFTSIKWFDSPAEALAWFETHDWEGDFGWIGGAIESFLEQAVAYLKTQAQNPA